MTKLLIDASNIKSGGGFTHLYEILVHIQPEQYSFSEISIIGGPILEKLRHLPWLNIIQPDKLMEGGFIKESWWKLNQLPDIAASYDLIFAPGGTFYSRKVRYVSMSQNMLVFQHEERWRYGISFMYFKLSLLNYFQTRSFRHSLATIFISEFARQRIRNLLPAAVKDTMIHHGISSRFLGKVKSQKSIEHYSVDNPLQLMYVSIIDVYKHQDNLIQAVIELRNNGLPIELHLVGGAYQPALRKIEKIIDDNNSFIKYHGFQPYESLEHFYKEADIFVFASSCENMPNILIEAMAAGLPIASSDKGPMKEFLKDGGYYFNPLEPSSIAISILEMIANPEERSVRAEKALAYSSKYSWEKCANETFSYLDKIGNSKN